MIGTENLTYEQYKAKKKRREISHPIVTDDDTVVLFEAAKDRLRLARARSDKTELAAAEAEYAEAEQAVRDATLVFRLRALPRKGDGSYAALKSEHPPKKSDDEDVQKELGDPKAKATWHSDTFGPALVAACLIEPKVTLGQAEEMATDLNDGEWNSLFSAAIVVNRNATDTAGLVFS